MPGCAPLGYLNDLRTHTIKKDPDRFRLVRKVFELYSTGGYSLKDLRGKIFDLGLVTKKGKMLSVSMVQSILQSPFYYGTFRYNGELHEGKHEPMIAKKLFEKCQKVLSDRSRPQRRKVNEFAFRGLLSCGECGCAITSETQKGHNYYRCTKKRGKCSQGYIREEVLVGQINQQIQKVSLPPSWADAMIAELENDREQEAQAGAVFAQNLKAQINELEDKLDVLLDTHLDGTIAKEEYILKKEKVLGQKIDISEKLKDFEQNGDHWLEPARKFILTSKYGGIIASQEDLFEKKDFLKKIGSNRILRERKLLLDPLGAWLIPAKAALGARRTPAPASGGGADDGQRTIWLAWQDAFRTFDWREAIGDPEVAIKQTRQLLALVP
jgi:hypothetical protein